MTDLMLQLAGGLQGIPIPYTLRHDDVVTSLLLLCFFITAFVALHSYKYLLLQTRGLFVGRQRASIFDTSTSMQLYECVLLLLQLCLLTGVCIYDISDKLHSASGVQPSSAVCIALYSACTLALILVKWLLFEVVGWIFFKRADMIEGIGAHFTLLYDLSMLLLPWTVLVVHFNLSATASIVGGAIGLFAIVLLALNKWSRLFCADLYGRILIIVYFCALEIIPMIIMALGVARINRYLFY